MTSQRGNLLRHRDFLKLWTAQTVSVFGTQITLLALPIIAATILKVTPFEFALLSTIETLPFIFLSLPAGVWVDRLRRRPILIVGDIGRAVALTSIPVAFALDSLTIWQLYLVGFLNGCLTVFFDVAYQSYLPSIVEPDQLVEGNSKLEITRSAAQILGPGAAGILIGILEAPFAIVIDALSTLVGCVRLLHPTARAGCEARPRGRARPPVDTRRDLHRPSLRRRPPLAALDRHDDRHLELLRECLRVDPHPLRDESAEHGGRSHRVGLLHRLCRGPRGGPLDQQSHQEGRGRADAGPDIDRVQPVGPPDRDRQRGVHLSRPCRERVPRPASAESAGISTRCRYVRRSPRSGCRER